MVSCFSSLTIIVVLHFMDFQNYAAVAVGSVWGSTLLLRQFGLEEVSYSENCPQNEDHTSNCHGNFSKASYIDKLIKKATND